MIMGRRERGGRLRGRHGRRDGGGIEEEFEDRGFEAGLLPHLLPLPFGVMIVIANLIGLHGARRPCRAPPATSGEWRTEGPRTRNRIKD
ncbi:hypothetical protein SLEP1_g14912 [Rubroshorea leprosula]|uniref:Uncharacterized protein n=1 Tax=Rubroshorea leprosula TaxID=152421 RepID=A0AAV5IV57_9ROSI|nr:hypothetical protein SLEP1_g14912 [Rubroshorea leprosula]